MKRRRLLLLTLFGSGLVCASPPRVLSATRYVNLANLSPQPPYTNWAMAATNIQAAVNSATNGETVLVTNGLYREPGEIVVSNAILLRSVNGAAVTAGDGGGTHRCFRLLTNAIL